MESGSKNEKQNKTKTKKKKQTNKQKQKKKERKTKQKNENPTKKSAFPVTLCRIENYSVSQKMTHVEMRNFD